MKFSELGRRTTSGTISEACWELIAPSGNSLLVHEMSIYLAAATSSSFGLGRPAAAGVTPTTPFLFQCLGLPATSAASTALAWATSPTAPSRYLRQVNFPNVIGSSVLWTFPVPIVVPASATLVLFNITATGVCDVNCTISEVTG